MILALLSSAILAAPVAARNQPDTHAVSSETAAQPIPVVTEPLVALMSVPVDPSTAKIAIRMEKAWNAGKYERATSLATRIVNLDPTNTRARFVRGMCNMHKALGTKNGPEASVYEAMAKADLEMVDDLAPQSEGAAMARLYLENAEPVLVLPEPACTQEAIGAETAAERHFARNEYSKSIENYESALSACPDNSTWWTWYGDAWLQDGDPEKAIGAYRKALEIDPCNWMAQRFLADVLFRTGKGEEGLPHLLVSAACNPRYEIGWASLGGLLDAVDLGFYGPQVNKAALAAEPAAIEGPKDEVRVARHAWETYAAAVAAVHNEMGSASPLAREREAVGRTLAQVRSTLPTATPHSAALRTWVVLARAEDDGCLDTGILILLLDHDLAPEFVMHRDADLANFATFIAKYLIWNTDGSPMGEHSGEPPSGP
jgi:tetratricopeptide (TPR) repeat protein